MKKEFYFVMGLRRENKLLAFVLDIFFRICSYPRLCIEVFIRKGFGERYFKLASAITVTVLLAILPPIADKMGTGLLNIIHQDEGWSEPSFWVRYATWYIGLAAFIYFALQRWQETKREPNVFDAAKLTTYAGRINPFFYHIPFLNIRPTIRQIECFYEPVGFFVAGVILSYLHQRVGGLLQWCSIIYSLSYYAAYLQGDNWIMDQLDISILNEQSADAFIGDLQPEDAKGVTFRMRRPKSSEVRTRLMDTLQSEINQDEFTLAE